MHSSKYARIEEAKYSFPAFIVCRVSDTSVFFHLGIAIVMAVSIRYHQHIATGLHQRLYDIEHTDSTRIPVGERHVAAEYYPTIPFVHNNPYQSASSPMNFDVVVILF